LRLFTRLSKGALRVADNPITFASDGFVSVTGYSRKDIVPRNCRFLQGPLTDKSSTKRLRNSIESAEETVELLLNYRKNGEPFWNLLYVSPLYDQHGNVAFFLGGQINCSTTIHSCTDILRILSLNDEGVLDQRIDYGNSTWIGRPPSERSIPASRAPSLKKRSSFFKSLRRQREDRINENVLPEAGMEGELVNKLGKLAFKTQVETFYTAYSKVTILSLLKF
jgi:PAS domain S-box-containing protein